MSVSSQLREQVRQRARFACDFCGATEAGTGGELTIDHFQPRSHGGSDDFWNLLYCCFRCNLYKADYWPTQATDPMLWNPLRESFEVHFLERLDGLLHPITGTGSFSIDRLRLNRPALVEFRLRRQAENTETKLLAQYRDLTAMLQVLYQQHAGLLLEHRALLETQRSMLTLLLKNLG